jgi:cytidyltransferase-like protein
VATAFVGTKKMAGDSKCTQPRILLPPWKAKKATTTFTVCPLQRFHLKTTSRQLTGVNGNSPSGHHHTLAILAMPFTSVDRIANEAILATALSHCCNSGDKLSVVLRCEGGSSPSLSSLRRYVGEIYSALWDCCYGSNDILLDVVVYPQNLPNAAPEQWIHRLEDLDTVCSHDSICGWISSAAQGRGSRYQEKLGDGRGGLESEVAAINAGRRQLNLPTVQALPVDPWPLGASIEFQRNNHVMFMDDEALDGVSTNQLTSDEQQKLHTENYTGKEVADNAENMILAGPRLSSKSLFQNAAVGGTFDGMHFGHRKLLTLAISSVNPSSGRLLVGVTVDEMLQHKQYAHYIPNLAERMEGVRQFVHRLAPGLKNRIRIAPISDAYGPPGKVELGAADFDALVLSHETLETGHRLNEHRVRQLGLPPLTLLCTRRTEPHGMSSTALRRLRSQTATPQSI